MTITKNDIQRAWPDVTIRKGAREKLYPPTVEFHGVVVPVQLVESEWRRGRAEEPEHVVVDTWHVAFTNSDGESVERVVSGELADVAEYLHNHARDASGVVRSSTTRWKGNVE